MPDFALKVFQEFVETNAPAPTVQLQIIRAVLDVIAYRRRNLRAMDVSRAFLVSGPLKRDTYAKLLDGGEKGNIARKLLKPLYVLSTACEDWYGNHTGFSSKWARGKLLP